MTFVHRSPQLATRETGSGTPVVLLHASFSDGRQWRSLTGYLEGRHRVVAVDLPGYGGSTATECDSLDAIAERLQPLVVGDVPVHIVGHSFGGAVALKMACRLPGHVRSLTLIEPPAIAALAPSARQDQASRAFDRAFLRSRIALAEGDAWEATRHAIDFWNGDGAWKRTSFRLRQVLASQVGQAHRDYAALATDRTNEQDLAGVVCPVLSLRGTRSPAITARVRDEVVAALPFARHEEIEDAGHMLPLTDPHVVDLKIGQFLAQVDWGWQDAAVPAPRIAA